MNDLQLLELLLIMIASHKPIIIWRLRRIEALQCLHWIFYTVRYVIQYSFLCVLHAMTVIAGCRRLTHWNLLTHLRMSLCCCWSKFFHTRALLKLRNAARCKCYFYVRCCSSKEDVFIRRKQAVNLHFVTLLAALVLRNVALRRKFAWKWRIF